jgi:cytochrome c peroxidase
MNNKNSFLTLCLLVVLSTILFAQNVPLTPKEQLGKELFFDKISDPDSISCSSCHASSTGFVGDIPDINKHGAVYPGAVPQRFGNRKLPSAAYATFSPIFHYDATKGFIGGNFWDGRATGERLGNPTVEQALGPFLNPVEQNNASKLAVLKQVINSMYASLWLTVWGEPLTLDSSKIDMNYDRIGFAIGVYEASKEVNQFSSKFDYYLDGLVDLTPKEKMGMELFNGDAKCSGCHVSNVDPVTNMKPLFTDFTFDNLGLPKNPENPFYRMDKVFLPDGSPINPQGAAWIDPGLGGFLANQPNLEWRTLADKNMGKFKVPTLRNVDKRPSNDFIKAYTHNGVFKSLKEVVHFYNTRDIASWPPPEVAENVNTSQLGNLGLTENEEDAIVTFLQTLSDGFTNDVPVELTSFTASISNGMINLNWNTATELNNRGFEVQRKSSIYDYITVAFINGNGTSTQPNNYSWSEKLQSGKYSYRLKQVDYNGKFEYSQKVEVTVIPNVFSLEQNFPNPFNPSTKINYTLPFDSKVTLEIYNITGKKIGQLVNEEQSAGYYSVDFNSSSFNKRFVSGVYFYRINATNKIDGTNFSLIKKMILLK